MAKILVIFHDANIRRLLGAVCARAGHEVSLDQLGGEGMAEMDREPADVVLAEYSLGGYGADAVRDCQTRHPETEVIIVSGSSDHLVAAEAKRIGAGDYLKLPFEIDTLPRKIESALSGRCDDS